jgi:signal transduction histidine kinase
MQRESGVADNGQVHPTRVLLIEDEELYQLFMKRMLRHACFGQVVLDTCETLADGVIAATGGQPDVILTDLTLPDSGGLDTVRAMARVSGSVPVIVLTGNGDTEAALSSLGIGAQDYLVKGDFNAETLARSIRHSMARAEAEDRLRRTADELARTNRDLQEYASLVAHDLRAPVRTGRLLADRLVDAAIKGAERSAVDQLATRLDQCMGRLDQTVIRLLDYASLHDHGMVYEQIDATTFLTNTVQDLQATLDAAGTEFVVDAAGSIAGDLSLLALVVRELVSNEIKFRHEERQPRGVLACNSTGADTELTVSDTGPGIPAEHREQVFGLFHRLHTRGEVEGLGFGLTYCRRIVDMHGGTISIDDGPGGVGTALTVAIPKEPAVVAARSPAMPTG